MDINAAGGSDAGASPEKIAALNDYKESDLFTAAEKVALELCDRATALPHDVSDEFFARLREHYSDPEIVELAYIVALENFRSRFNRTLRIEAQGFYCPLPAEHPARAGI